MPVVMIGEAEGLDAEAYLGMFRALEPALRDAPGFILHAGHAIDDKTFRVIEIWRSKRESDAFFVANVVPKLPPHIRPKRRTVPLSALSLGGDAIETYAAGNVITRRSQTVAAE